MTTFATASLRVLEALVTPHGIDRYTELIDPMLTVHEMRGKVTSVRRPTADTVTLAVRPTRQWKGFRAGQFVPVTVLIDGVRHTRCYSPSGSQHRGGAGFELTVKTTPDGVVSSWLVTHARPGLVLGLGAPDGGFTLPDDRPDRILLLSGGSGITPFLSMLRTLADEGHRGEVVLVHYDDRDEDVIDHAELATLESALDGLRVVVRHPEQHGYFSGDRLEGIVPWYADAQTYVCGPAGLMRAVREHFVACDLLERLHAEEFRPALSVVPGDATGTLNFAVSGTAVDNDGSTLLEQAEAAGLSPQYGCRMGICFSCTQVKRSGCTRNIRTGETDSDPDTDIQLCINVPVGDVAIDI